MRKLYRRFKETEDRGAALVLVGATLLLLMGMAAFGTDLAWFYLNSSRIQRAADAASLGGVVWLPGDEVTAKDTAWDVAVQNGYTDTVNAVVTPETDTEDPVALSPNQLRVTISADVPTFFLKVFGFNSQIIVETATAEYIPPLKLGSRSNQFGNDPECYSSNPDCAGNFWANIHGRQTDTRMGDAYSSFCFDNGGSTNGCAKNPSYRDTGYLYGITPDDTSFTLETLDMAFQNELGGVTNADQFRTGDHNNFCSGGSCDGPTVTVKVWDTDPTPLDISDNDPTTDLLCTKTYGPESPTPPLPDDDPPSFDYANNWDAFGKGWDSVCTVSGATPDAIYVVQIVNTSSNVNTSGLNRYSIRTTSPDDKIFGLGDFSMFNNSSATISNFDLAEVPDFYDGKTFVVELYDPGDSNAGGDVQLLDPSGSIFTTCEMYTRTGDVVDEAWTFRDTLSPCSFTALNNGGGDDYNGDWIRLESVLPTPYSCDPCWWQIAYEFVGGVQDTTTWRAFMIGNPIHLVP